MILPTMLGTEAFGLRAIGQAALRQQNMDLLRIAHTIRAGPQAAMFFPGLLVLAAGAVLIGVAVWNSGALPKPSGVFIAAGLALFFPLFPQPIRIIDGLLTGAGGTWIALSILRSASSLGIPAVDQPRASVRRGPIR